MLPELPLISKTTPTERIGVRELQAFVEDQLGWLYRAIPRDIDYGVDAQIEIIEGRRVTGRQLAIQVKSGSSYQKSPNAAGFTFYGKKAHLNYWLNGSLPVVLVFFHQETKELHWAHVRRPDAAETPKGWKIHVPRQQRVDHKVREAWAGIANQVPPGAVFSRKLPPAVAAMLDQEDDDFDFLPQFSPGRFGVAVFLKPSALNRTRSVSMAFTVGAEVRKLEQHSKTGVGVAVSGTITSSDLPIFRDSIGEQWTVHLPTKKLDINTWVEITAVPGDRSRAIFAIQDTFQCESAGSEQIVISNRQSAQAQKFTWTFTGDFRAAPVYLDADVTCDLPINGASISVALRSLRLIAALSSEGSRLRVASQEQGLLVETEVTWRDVDSQLVDSCITLLENLLKLQTALNIQFKVPDGGLDLTEAGLVRELVEIVETGKFLMPACEFTLPNIQLTAPVDLEVKPGNALLNLEKHDRRVIFGEVIDLGPVKVALQEPQMQFAGQPERKTAQTGETVTLISRQKAGTATYFYERFLPVHPDYSFLEPTTPPVSPVKAAKQGSAQLMLPF